VNLCQHWRASAYEKSHGLPLAAWLFPKSYTSLAIHSEIVNEGELLGMWFRFLHGLPREPSRCTMGTASREDEPEEAK